MLTHHRYYPIHSQPALQGAFERLKNWVNSGLEEDPQPGGAWSAEEPANGDRIRLEVSPYGTAQSVQSARFGFRLTQTCLPTHRTQVRLEQGTPESVAACLQALEAVAA